jgi:hypothetical protein
MAEIRVDEELLERIKKLIEKGENRFDFPSVKAFADRAILKMLKELEKDKK